MLALPIKRFIEICTRFGLLIVSKPFSILPISLYIIKIQGWFGTYQESKAKIADCINCNFVSNRDLYFNDFEMLAFVKQKPLSLLVICMSMLGLSESVPPLRIIGGNDAEPGEHPYVLRMEAYEPDLRYESDITRHQCTVAALTATWVLTAAHCVDDEKEKFLIRYHEYGQPASREKSSKVISNHLFPRYRTSENFHEVADIMFMYNDIAISKTEPMQLRHFGKLSSVDFPALRGLPVTVVGFGITLYDDELDDTKTLNKPLQVTRGIIEACDFNPVNYPSMCLAPRCVEAAWICGGDSGGPVIHASGIVGVNSWGNTDCSSEDSTTEAFTGLVAAVTPVSPYLSWIRNVMLEDEKNRTPA